MLRTDQTYRLSRFSMLQSASDGFVLSTPLNRKQFIVKSESVFRLLLLLRNPSRIDQVLDSVDVCARPVIHRFLAALEEADLLTSIDAGGKAEEETNALGHWEFHDLLFHSRSRLGRNPAPLGGTYRLKGHLEEEPALRAECKETAIELPKPGADSNAMCCVSLTDVTEKRRSERSSEPVTLAQLSELLYSSCRVTEKVAGKQGVHIRKVYPSGGGLHPLETYVLIHSCSGVAPGLYRYSGLNHSLYRIAPLDKRGYKLLDDARFSAGEMADYPAILVIIAARSRRTAWKYEGIAYRLMLLEAGGLVQTMCLFGEALGLACCWLGCGDSDLFSELAGVDYFMETSIAELIVGGAVPPPAERAR